MYNHILVPLDGSELAECVLVHVEHIGTGGGQAKVSLVRVVDPDILPANDPTSAEFGLTRSDRQQLVRRRSKAARQYLDDMKKRLIWDWADIDCQVLIGEPAESLARFANENGVDLIVIASHGRSGIKRLIMGSIADAIIRSSCAPVLLVRAPGCIPRV
jgi:nucleotide-binding universal stress UspA family protein